MMMDVLVVVLWNQPVWRRMRKESKTERMKGRNTVVFATMLKEWLPEAAAAAAAAVSMKPHHPHTPRPSPNNCNEDNAVLVLEKDLEEEFQIATKLVS